MALAVHLARELDKRKGHNGMQDDLGASKDEPRDDRSVRKSIRSSTKESRFIVHQPTMPWLQRCSLVKSPPPYLLKDNEEVNMHVKRLQAMLDAATVAV
jgi:hypothetical protein